MSCRSVVFVLLVLSSIFAFIVHNAEGSKVGPTDQKLTGEYIFTAPNGVTQCRLCQIDCMKYDHILTGCNPQYYNYGCHAKDYCLRDEGNVDFEFTAAIAYCTVWNGCSFQKSVSSNSEVFLRSRPMALLHDEISYYRGRAKQCGETRGIKDPKNSRHVSCGQISQLRQNLEGQLSQQRVDYLSTPGLDHMTRIKREALWELDPSASFFYYYKMIQDVAKLLKEGKSNQEIMLNMSLMNNRVNRLPKWFRNMYHLRAFDNSMLNQIRTQYQKYGVTRLDLISESIKEYGVNKKKGKEYLRLFKSNQSTRNFFDVFFRPINKNEMRVLKTIRCGDIVRISGNNKRYNYLTPSNHSHMKNLQGLRFIPRTNDNLQAWTIHCPNQVDNEKFRVVTRRMKICLRSLHTKRFVSAENTGCSGKSGCLNLFRGHCKSWEQFVVLPVKSVEIGEPMGLFSHQKRYVVHDRDGIARANRSKFKSWERLYFEKF